VQITASTSIRVNGAESVIGHCDPQQVIFDFEWCHLVFVGQLKRDDFSQRGIGDKPLMPIDFQFELGGHRPDDVRLVDYFIAHQKLPQFHAGFFMAGQRLLQLIFCNQPGLE
jgi:hypothetical protein